MKNPCHEAALGLSRYLNLKSVSISCHVGVKRHCVYGDCQVPWDLEILRVTCFPSGSVNVDARLHYNGGPAVSITVSSGCWRDLHAILGGQLIEEMRKREGVSS